MGVYDYDVPDFLNVDASDAVKSILKETVAPYTPPPEPVAEEGEFIKGVKRGMEGLKSAGYGAAGLIGSGLGIDALRDWGYEGFQEHEEEAAKHAGRVQNIEDIKSIGDVGDWAAGTFGSLVPSIGEAAVMSAAGAIVGSAIGPEGTIGGAVTGLVGKQAAKSMMRKLAREYVKDGMERQVAKEAAKKAVESLPAKALMRNVGTKAGIVAGTAPIEAGGMWGEGMQQGKDNPYSAAVFGTLSGLSELLGGEAELIDVFTNPARQAVKGNILQRVGVELGKTIPQEAGQEATQEILAIINRKAVDPSYDMFGEDARSRVLNSAAAGALGGVAFGGVGGVMSGKSAERETGTEEETPNLQSPVPEIDPWKEAEEPPHPVTAAEVEEQPVIPEAPKGPLTRAAEAGTAAIPSIGDVTAAPVSPIGTVPNIGEVVPIIAPTRTTDELVLDDARDWAQKQIAAGKTQLMRQTQEAQNTYNQRLVDEYRRSTATPSMPDSGPKYANVQLVNPETGKAEVVKPEEVADRLSKGWREQGQERAPSPQPPATESILSTVSDADRDALRMAQLRADYWERGSVDNGRSNKTELFPWLNTWGKTTPAEVGKAIGNFLEGKKLGDVQRRLVEAALEFERENPVPFAEEQKSTTEVSRDEKAQEEVRGQGEKRQVTLSEGERKKAEMYAEKAGIDLEGWPNEDIAGFVKQYDAWRFAERQKEHITQKLRATKDPKARERLLKTLEQVRQRQEKLIPKGVTDVEETTDIQRATGETSTGAETVQPVPELDGQPGAGMPVVQPADEVEADSAPSPQPPAPNKGGVQSGLSEVQEEERGKEEEVSPVRGETIAGKAGEQKARFAEARRKHILRKLAESKEPKEHERLQKALARLEAERDSTKQGKPEGKTEAGKEPWEMTREEFVKSLGMDEKFIPPQPKREAARIVKREDGSVWQTGEHGKAVYEALRKGKPVSPEVLAEYPELQKTSETKPATIPATEEERPAEAAPPTPEEKASNRERFKAAQVRHIRKKLAETQTAKEKERYAKLLEKLQARKQDADFVKTPDGSIDFGKIDTEIRGKDSKVYPAGPIRLEHGGEYGRAHIAESRIQEFKDYGYADELAALKDIASNYTEIYEQPNGRLLLVKRNGRGKYASVELQRAGDYYGVTTWFLEDANPKSKTPYEKRGGRSLLLRVAHADDLGKSSSFPESGTQGQAGNSRRSNQSNDRNNISPSSGKVKNENVNDKTVPSASYGEDNKIFTKDRADKAREILRKKLSQVNTGLDPEMIQAGIDLAGYHIEAGARAFAEYAKRMAADLGEEIRPYLKSFYLAVRNYPGFDNAGMETEAQVEDSLLSKPTPDDIVANEIKPTKIGGDENVERSDSDMERNSGNSEPENGVGEETLSDDGRRDNKGVRRGGERAEDAEFEPGRDPVLPRSEALTPGERGNPQVQGTEQQAESASRAAGSEFGERSGDFDVSREAPEPVTTAAVDKAAARVAELADRRKTQAAAQDVPVVAGDRANIAKSLPVLFPGQLEDVGFAEDRFATPDGYGVMFTNGTGTGKTFSGLGIIKRFERRGKKNIIIVAPSDNVINDWIKSGKNLLLDISPLSSTKDAGSGIVITTYENFGQNEALVKRGWDLVVFDESHKLNSNKSGSATNAQNMMQAITLHPEGKWLRAQLLHKDLLDKLKEMRDDAKSLSNSDFDQNWAEASALQPKIDALTREWESARKAVEQEVKTAQGAARPRVVFLSATPFAYDKNIDYANGYLFDYNEGQGDESQRTGYNSGSKHDRFFMTHFGYRMRYNKLTEPPAEVDQGIMHRQFNSWLKSRKVLSGRMLEVEPDYDRRFILADSAIGRKIDEGLEYLRENDEFRPIYDHVIKKFDYLTRHFLLEAIKAREVIPHIREHMAMGRKVVVFHDYKQGGGVNLFDVQSLVNNEGEVQVGTYPNYQTVKMGDVAKHFIAARPDLVKLPFGSYGSALDTLRAEFPDALVVNGDETRRNNVRAAEQFQDDESGRNLIIVQADKGKEGISLHDTTGRHQRVMFNLGLPVKPTMAIQQEGRIYRTGQASNAMMRYLNTGTNWERFAFATTIARRASTAENLASGEQARMLLDAFVQGFEESDDYRAGHEGEGTGGKERDKAANAALTEWDRAITYYFGQQKKTSRNKAQEGVDYFATPEPLGLKMVEWADIRPGDSVLEPSGGHGAIARWFPDQSRRRMIEPSLELASRAALVFDGDIVQGRFEDHNIVNKYDAIVMNPPFGSGGRTAVDHLEKAARHLKDGGRIVAIIPRGPAADKKFDKWMDGEESRPVEPIGSLEDGTEIYKGDTLVIKGLPTGSSIEGKVSEQVVSRIEGNFFYTADKDFPGVNLLAVTTVKPTGKREAKVKNDLYLAADISLPPITFERAGTKVAARIVVLDKAKDVQQSSRDYSDTETIKEFFDRIEGATIPNRQIVQPVEEEQAPAAPAVKAEGGVTLGVFNHTKTGKPLYVATVNDRLDTAVYSGVNAVAKKHKGYYNSYAKNGAIKGFIFDSEANRDAFVEEIAPGEKQTAEENEPVRFALRPDMSNDEALPGLVERGLREFSPSMKYPEFAKRMKAALGNMWERFKGLMLKVWGEVRAKFLDERGSFNYREMKVPADKSLFERVGVEQGNIFADYIRLQEKHPEYFSTLEDVRRHVEFVVENPSDILPATKDGYTLLVRNDGKDRAAVVEFVQRGGKYRVRSAYILEEGQLEVKRQKALHAVSKPNPPENLGENIEEGGGVPSDTLRAEPSSDDSIASADDDVKFAVGATSYGLPASDIRAALEPLRSNLKNSPPWRVVQTADELPAGVLSDAAKRHMPKWSLQATHYRGEIIYVADNFNSIKEAGSRAIHEVVAHYGIKAIMPFKEYKTEMLRADLYYINKKRDMYLALVKAYGLDRTTQEGRMAAAEEMIAREAEAGATSTVLSRIIAAVKEFLRSHGYDFGYGEAEIRELLGKARRFVEGKESPAPSPQPRPGAIDYGALLRKLREQGIPEGQLQAFAAYEHGGAVSFALARLQDVKGQIVDKGVSLNTTDREVLEADRAKAVEAIGETVKDYDEPGRFVFRAFYESDQDKAPGVVPYNPERGHYASGENLKGSWWTTSLSTAQEIAWSKSRDGRPVKIVALPVDKLPSDKVYIQNTNPPGFVYDLFVGLPADVPMKDVHEMPVDSGIRYALADRFAGYVGEMQGGEVWKRIARFLNPLDWSHAYRWFKEITPQNIQNGLARVLRDPIGAAEVDDNKKPLVDTGIQRERNKTSLILRLYGWFGPREKIPNFIERFTKTFTSWHNNDLTTAWGRIVDEYGKLSQDDRKGVDWLLYRGDVDGKVYRTYDMAKGDKKVSRKLPSEAAFNVYLQVRTHIDTTVADTIEEITRQFMAENGMSGEEIEKHIFTYRQGLARHVGWLPRNHGEGNWQVNIYQRITGLKWDIGQYQATKHVKYLTKDGKTVEFERTIDALSAYLPYFPSHDVAKEIKTLAKRFGLAYEQENGRQRVYVDKGAAKRITKAVEKLKTDLAGETLDAAGREKLQQKLDSLENTLAFIKGYSQSEQIRFFVKQSAKIIGKLEDKNLMSIHRAKENLKQAIEDKESATEIRRLEDELEKLGDGSIKVKVYMKLQGSRRKADKHMKDIQRDMRKAIPENFRENAVYEVKVKFNDRISESTYGDMQNDFAQEQAQLKAIERASSKQGITKEEAAAIRHQIIQSTAEVLMARGAGAHRIQRAEYLIEGYDTENTLDAYQDYMTGTAGMLSKAKYAHDQFENFRYAKPEVKAWAEQYIRDTLRNMGYGDMVSGNLRSLASLSYLGFKVSSMVINATQPWTIGIAHLGMLTKRSPVKAMAKAQRDILSGKIAKKKGEIGITESEAKIFASEIWKEQEQKTAVHEMAGSGEGATGKVSRFMHTLTDKALFGFQEVEMLNRKTVILAAYRTFRADGMEHGEALKKALEVNGHVNNEMSRANKPGIAQNPVGNTLFTLQSFTWRTWNWVFNRLTSGKKEDMIALLRYAAAMAIIGGVAALPGGDELDKLYQILFGESPKLAFQKWTRKHAREYGSLAEMVNGFAWHGLASATGVNISNAMRLQIPIVSPVLSGDSLPEAAGGVFTGLAQKGARAITAASRGDIYRMIENISPEALAGGMRAYRMATKGATTGTGKVIFDENGRPMKYGVGEAVTRAFGFQPSRVSERNELTNVEKGLSAHWKEERGDLLAELRLSKPGTDRRKVMLEIVKFNHRLNKSQAKGLVPVIKAQTIKQALSAKPNKSKSEWEREQLGG